MKISEHWLREWVNPPITREKLIHQLTMAGLEIEAADDGGEGNDVLDLKVTPNRGDCLSVLGVAREVALLNECALHAPKMSAVPAKSQTTFPVTVKDSAACPRYVGRVIRNVNASATSPAWLQEKLRSSGIQSILPVVDVTNYVLLELGQPLHAFDLDKLTGGIQVRMAQAGEKLLLLDGETVELKPDVLVIADEKAAHAMAGVMGGLESAVSLTTKNIFLESAFFTPHIIANRARRYGLNTDSAYRFERGVDPNLQTLAIERATQLLLEIVGGEAGPLIEKVSEKDLPKIQPIALRQKKITRLLGMPLSQAVVEKILAGLQMKMVSDSDGWQVTPPTYRFDIAIEEDLIEELARVYGYDNFLPRHPSTKPVMQVIHDTHLPRERLRNILVDRGYHEAITYSFVDPSLQHQFDPEHEAIALVNPISPDLSVMRTNLWPGLVSALIYNKNRQQERVRLFEIGMRFIQTGKEITQENVISGAVVGGAYPENWGEPKRAVDFYDIKGDIQAILSLTKSTEVFAYKPATYPALHPGQSAIVLRGDKEIGMFGRLHPSIEQTLGLETATWVFELVLNEASRVELPRYKSFSKFPFIRRDIAFYVNDHTTFDEIRHTVEKAAGDLLQQIIIFDVYQGKSVPTGQKSIALGLTLQHHERTLIDDEINGLVGRVVSALQQTLDITMRT